MSKDFESSPAGSETALPATRAKLAQTAPALVQHKVSQDHRTALEAGEECIKDSLPNDAIAARTPAVYHDNDDEAYSLTPGGKAGREYARASQRRSDVIPRARSGHGEKSAVSPSEKQSVKPAKLPEMKCDQISDLLAKGAEARGRDLPSDRRAREAQPDKSRKPAADRPSSVSASHAARPVITGAPPRSQKPLLDSRAAAADPKSQRKAPTARNISTALLHARIEKDGLKQASQTTVQIASRYALPRSGTNRSLGPLRDVSANARTPVRSSAKPSSTAQHPMLTEPRPTCAKTAAPTPVSHPDVGKLKRRGDESDEDSARPTASSRPAKRSRGADTGASGKLVSSAPAREAARLRAAKSEYDIASIPACPSGKGTRGPAKRTAAKGKSAVPKGASRKAPIDAVDDGAEYKQKGSTHRSKPSLKPVSDTPQAAPRRSGRNSIPASVAKKRDGDTASDSRRSVAASTTEKVSERTIPAKSRTVVNDEDDGDEVQVQDEDGDESPKVSSRAALAGNAKSAIAVSDVQISAPGRPLGQSQRPLSLLQRAGQSQHDPVQISDREESSSEASLSPVHPARTTTRGEQRSGLETAAIRTPHHVRSSPPIEKSVDTRAVASTKSIYKDGLKIKFSARGPENQGSLSVRKGSDGRLELLPQSESRLAVARGPFAVEPSPRRGKISKGAPPSNVADDDEHASRSTLIASLRRSSLDRRIKSKTAGQR